MGYINTLGEYVIPASYLESRCFSEGLAAVGMRMGWDFVYNEITREPGYVYKWGFIDTYGRMVADYQFDEIRDFREGMAAVAKRNEEGNLVWGFINTAGELAVPLQFTWVEDFHEGFAVVNHGADVYHPQAVHWHSYLQGTHIVGGFLCLLTAGGVWCWTCPRMMRWVIFPRGCWRLTKGGS
jgi:hypothetical protein